MARSEKQILAKMSKLDPDGKYSIPLRKMIELEKSDEFRDALAMEILERGLSHPVWRYAAIRRLGKNPKKRAKLLKKKLVTSSLQPEYWLKQGFGEIEAKERAREEGVKRSASFRTETAVANRLAVLKETGEKIRKSLNERWQNLDPEVRKVESAKKARVMISLSKRRQPKHFNGKVEFWTSRGYSEVQAREIISNRARRDLNYFVEKYGEAEGKLRFNEMRRRRAKTWATMDKVKLKEINEKRSINGHVGYYTEETIVKVKSLYFYAFVFKGGVKYGLTKNDSIEKRWPLHLVERVLCFDCFDSLRGLKVERYFKDRFGRTRNEELKTTEYIPGISPGEFIEIYKEATSD